MGALRVTAVALVPAMLGLAACAPALIPVHDAEVLCTQLALDNENNSRLQVGIGVGTGSWRGGYGSVGMSTSTPIARDPARFYRDCVIRRAGVAPTKDFYEQLGARGK